MCMLLFHLLNLRFQLGFIRGFFGCIGQGCDVAGVFGAVSNAPALSCTLKLKLA